MKLAEANLGRWGLVALCAAIIWGLGRAAHPGQLEELSGGARNTDYNLLVRGFQAGQLALILPAPAALTRLSDPYDPAANALLRTGVPPLHDLSYWKGRLYLYFGVTPAVTLFWPVAALTGHYLWEWQAAAIFAALGFVTGAAILCDLRRRYFPAQSRGILGVGIIGFGLATGLPLLLSRVELYEAAISAGFAFMLLAFGAFWLALHSGAAARWWFLALGIAVGLALGARPTLMPAAGALALFSARAVLRPAASLTGEIRLGSLFAVVGPILVIGLGLLIYNYARFGNPTEFGQHYQLGAARQDTRALFDWHYIFYNLRVYWFQPPRLTAHFPFFARPSVPAPAGHAPAEDPYGVLSCVPYLVLAIFTPLAWRGRGAEVVHLREWLAAVAVVAVGSVCLLAFYYYAASRYEIEFIAPLGLLAACGVLALARALDAHRPGWSVPGLGLCVLLLIGSCGFEALASIGHYAEAQNDYAAALIRLGRAPEAVPILRRVLRLKVDLPSAHINLGNALVRTGQMTTAEAEFAAALRLEPGNFEARNNLAEALTQSGQFEQAAAQYAQALKLRPNSAQLHSHRGYALMHAGHPDQALEEIEAAARASDP